MSSIVQDEVFEALLKAAVIENSLKEIAYYPLDEILKIKISPECDDRIQKRLNKYYRIQQLEKILVTVKKTAACIAIILGITFGILLQNDEVRAACYDVIVSIYDRFIEFRYYDKGGDGEIIGIPGYLPAGYEEMSDESRAGYIFKCFSNGKNQIVIRANNNQAFLLQIDNENYEVTDVTINGFDAKLFISIDGEVNRLLWNCESGSVEITGYLSEEELINIGENLK